MIEKIQKTIATCDLLSPGDSVLVALSGGPDSVALLHVLSRLRRKLRLSLSAVYVNHRIRPRAARREEQLCQELCDKLGIELTVASEDIPRLAGERKQGLEETAREVRYAIFEALAEQDGHTRVALAHHADDRVETVLFRILRGTGPTGLQGIPVKRGIYVRPLHEVTKSEILAYLKRHRLPYCIDQSNAGVEYDRNFIRNRLLPVIRQRLNPNVDAALLNLSEIAAEEDALLNSYTEKVARRLLKRTIGNKFELDISRFERYDTWLRRRLLRHCLAASSGTAGGLDKAVIDRLDRLCRSGGKALALPGAMHAVRAGDRLVLYAHRVPSYEQPLQPGRVTRLEKVRLDIRCRVNRSAKTAADRKRRSRRVSLDWNRLSAPLVVRNIRRGDRFVPLGMTGSKKVGDYLTDRKVPPVYRDEIPVVCDTAGIVWLVGFEIADRVKLKAGTREVVTIEVSERRQSQTHSV